MHLVIDGKALPVRPDAPLMQVRAAARALSALCQCEVKILAREGYPLLTYRRGFTVARLG